jgi:putative two-component system response regulator
MKENPRLLIVDDDPAACTAIGRVLASANFGFAIATSSTEALRALEKRSFDLVLSDVNMPGQTGIDLARVLATEHNDVALLMVTAVDDPRIGKQAMDLGAYGYLIKPFKPNELLLSVVNALRRRELEIAHRSQTKRLERAVAERTRELSTVVKNLARSHELIRRSHEEMIYRLAKAAEFRDDETAEHLQRMSRYCQLIARHLGKSEDECDEIRLACMMHDVGKIGIPDAILLKPGKFTDEEYRVMKSHSEIGHKILATSLTQTSQQTLDLAATIALTHHEKFDGTGYPLRLAGKAIPLEGRVAAIADVFDAMTSKRIYRDAIPVPNVIDFMKENRAKHFDPEILDLFFDSMDEVLVIKEKYADHMPGMTQEVKALNFVNAAG